MFKYKGHCFE